MDSLTPKEIVANLDKYIIGQHKAKKAVAIALRNRYRRMKVEKKLQEEILPKNIIMIGPTGSGKTEIAKRLAKLANAPFVKVEATKFTEVGYVGRDVDSMVRDLVEYSVKMCKEQAMEALKDQAYESAQEKMLEILLPKAKPFENAINENLEQSSETKEKMRKLLQAGALDSKEVTIEVNINNTSMPTMHMFGQGNIEDMTNQIQEALQGVLGKNRTKKRKMSVKEAVEVLQIQEAQKLIDIEQVQKDAVLLAEQSGIIFIDEIDKIAKAEGSRGPDVSREGVQRDILPIVEGSSVTTKYGLVKTDHILFIAAGAFHISKPSDLIPELQGRFPIRVELESLTQEDFVRILTEPENSLVKQYSALLATENVTIDFENSGIEAIAKVALQVNTSQENIGARRLYTIMEKLLEEESFNASELLQSNIKVDASMVQERLNGIIQDQDLSKYIL